MKVLSKKRVKRRVKFLLDPYKQNKTNQAYKNAHKFKKYYENSPLDNEMILYESRAGQSLTDNPYAIFKEIISRPEFKDFKHVWVVKNDEESIAFFEKIKSKNIQVSFVKVSTVEYYEKLAKAKYVINNATFPATYIKKENQIYINTWHGTPLKSMGFDIPGNPDHSKNVVRNFLMADFILSPNKHTSDILLDSYKLRGLYSGEIIENGYPRIDQTLNKKDDAMFNALYPADLDIDNNKKTILYAPTWKGSNVNSATNNINQIVAELSYLKSEVGSEYNIIFKAHPFLYNKIKNDERISGILVSDLIDTNQLLTEVDLLITDFSSIFFDYLVTDKPIIFYTWDEDLYESNRGMYIEAEKLPGPKFETIVDLSAGIKDIEKHTSEYQDIYRECKKKYVPYETGHVTAELVDYIFNKQEIQLVKYNNLDKEKEKIVFYPGGLMNNGITSSFINLTNNIDYTKYDVTCFVGSSNKAEVLNNYKKLNPNVRLIFKLGVPVYSLFETYCHNLMNQRGRIGWLKLLKFPLTSTKRENRRLFGTSSFDYAIDFSGYSFFWSKYILATNAKKKYCYQHNDLLSDSERLVNGKRPHRTNLRSLFSVYKFYDKLFSVSQATMELNKYNLISYADEDKFDVLINTINPDKILKPIEEVVHPKYIIKQNNQNFSFKDEEILIFKSLNDIPTTGESLDNQLEVGIVKAIAKVEYINEQTGEVEKTYRKILIDDVYVGWINEEQLDAPDKKHGRIDGSIIDQSKFNFINMGRLSPEKAQDNLIYAFKKYYEKNENARLYILGSGALENQLKQIIKEEELEEVVTLLGHVENPFAIMEKCDSFVLSSHYEGQPMVLLEALTLGMKVLATDIVANRYVLEDGAYGILVENSIEGLAEGMEKIELAKKEDFKVFDYESYNRKATLDFESKLK